MTAVVHPRLPARRGRPWARSWWARAWVRAVEEATYDERDLRRGRALARDGSPGAVQVEPGGIRSAVVEHRRGAEAVWSVTVGLPVLDAPGRHALVEAVAASPGRVDALLGGELPHDLVEHAEEAGVELVPYGGELAATCTCPAPVDPCPHALAVLLQTGWLLEDDPLVLLHLRGLPRADLLAAVHRLRPRTPDAEDLAGGLAGDLAAAEDAALRAERILALLDEDAPEDHAAEVDRLW